MTEHWLVTGASRGIGEEVARQVAARGDHVTPSVRDVGKRQSFELVGVGEPLIFDTRDDAAIRAAAATVSHPVDVLVANAGSYGPKRQSTLDMDFDGVLDLFNINALGPLRTAQAFLPLLRESKNPRIVFISSVLGSMALAGSYNIGYRAAKAALNKFMQGLAEDLHEQGVTVVSMHPGWVRTDMGGPDAPLSVEDSAAGVIKQIDALTIERTGSFFNYRGEIVAW